MMRSPTILAVLPEGGDSRKQMMMIFVLAVIGCGVFTIYAAGLFFRHKSRETGVLLALGADRGRLQSELYKELATLSLASCSAGMLLGSPLAWLLWKAFRIMVVDTEEMKLSIDPQAYLFALVFSACVTAALFLQGLRSVRRANIIEIVQESHKSEPVREVPRWYGPVGIGLIVLGGFLGYMSSSFFILVLRWYPPEGLSAVFYLPALAGLYMILLHTVVNGWRKQKGRYHDLIAVSMMKFQGRQTVRNMLVMTLLIAGAYFASFYTPMLGTGAMLGYDRRTVDYSYHFRDDQDIPLEAEVRAIAEDYNVNITSWADVPMSRFAVDGTEHVETKGALGVTWEPVYMERFQSELFLSASSYTALTGEPLKLNPGEAAAVMDPETGSGGVFAGDAGLITNALTNRELAVANLVELQNDMLFGHYILNDDDYAMLSEGLSEEWRERLVWFNVENCTETYDFAKALFYEIVDRSNNDVAVPEYWDPVIREREVAEKGYYFMDPSYLKEIGDPEIISYDKRDSSSFRLYWQYMPKFRVLDKADFVKTTAVFLILFIFISIVCFAAVIVIAFTRCMTIALTNAQVYEDLKKLGAPDAYLYRSARGQITRVYLAPIIASTSLIYFFYMLIMYFNGSPVGITYSEAAGLLACLAVIAGVSALFYSMYRFTLKRVCAALSIRKRRFLSFH